MCWEKLWKAAHALHPEGSREAEQFAYERAKRILSGQVSQVVKGLRLIATKRKLTATKAKTLQEVAGYLHSNRERMKYDVYLARGWPIASRSVEGACKNLIRDRFERSGMRWTNKQPKPCCAYAPSTPPVTSTPTGSSTSKPTSSVYTAKTNGNSF